MLESITIKNLALISDAELEFGRRLNILSGETGAGKSIIVDALKLLMGGKYDKTMLSYSSTSGYVEGVFSFATDKIPEYLLDYDVEELLIIRRKFNSDGKNEIKINGRTVTASMLKSITSNFVDICGQNEYQILSKKSEHAVILDAFVSEDIKTDLTDILLLYGEYSSVIKKLNSIGDVLQRERRIDMLKYQIDEIESAAIFEGELDELNELKQKFLFSEKIKTALLDAVNTLDGEGGCYEQIVRVVRAASSISSISQPYEELHDRLVSLEIELNDILSTSSALLDETDFDPQVLEDTESRIALIKNMQRKYGDVSKLEAFSQKCKEELNLLENSDEMYEKLRLSKTKLVDKLYDSSKSLSQKRREGAKAFERELISELATLGMEKASFSISFDELPSREDCEEFITQKGLDNIEFYLSPNVGQPLMPLLKIISGGEMSRFMLAIKVMSSKFSGFETMIFDEIDAGISGKIGQEVARKLAKIAQNCQVLCVTHLPQIASMADVHYYISKSDDGISTQTDITKLDRGGMVDEIARLSGGAGISKNSNSSADEMKSWSENYKKEL